MLNELSVDEWNLLKFCIDTAISEGYSDETTAKLESLEKKVQAIVEDTDRKALFTKKHPLEMEGLWNIFIYIFNGKNSLDDNVEVFYGTYNGTWKMISNIAWEANRSYKFPKVDLINSHGV